MARDDSTGRDLQQRETAAQQRLAQAIFDDDQTRTDAPPGSGLSYLNAESKTKTVGVNTPLPVRLLDGTDALTFLGDGETVVRLIADTEGTTIGTAAFGADAEDVARLLLTDRYGRAQATDKSAHDLLSQILLELKAMNVHLSSITDAAISGTDMEH